MIIELCLGSILYFDRLLSSLHIIYFLNLEDSFVHFCKQKINSLIWMAATDTLYILYIVDIDYLDRWLNEGFIP